MALLMNVVAMVNARAADDPCVGDPAPGGEWVSYGQDPTNARRQDAETTISPSNVHELEQVWAVSSTEAGGGGGFQSTAAVAGGCVFAGTSDGSMFAFDATTGDVIWRVKYETFGSYSTGIFAPAVVDDVVYVNVATNSGLPYVVALDASDGTQRWRTDLNHGLADGAVSLFGVIASPVVIDDMLFVPVTGLGFSSTSHPSYYFLDRRDGQVIKKTIVIPQDEWVTVDPSTGGLPVHVHAGGSIWSTAAVDHANGYLYAGTGNPESKRDEHPYTNAILQIDADPSRATFGEIVASYRGDVDHTPEQYGTMECQYLGEAQVVWWGIFCGQRDIDFGASPNLFTNSDGRTIVGAVQKSCTYHAAFADTMALAWKRPDLGPGGANGCVATAAYDTNAIYLNVNGDNLLAFDKDTGETRWVTSYGSSRAQHAQPVTIANGVVYVLTPRGELLAVDAASGDILLQESIGPECLATVGGGISIAYNTVFAECDSGGLVAYRLLS